MSENVSREPAPDGQEDAIIDAASPAPVSMFRDPFVRRLSYLAAVLVVLFLVAIVSTLVMGLVNPDYPRTRGERDVQIKQLEAMQNPADAAAWGEYLRSLINTGQFVRAQSVIDQAAEAINEDATQDISFYQAVLYSEQGRHEEAIEAAEALRAQLDEYHQAQLKIPDSPEDRGKEIHDNYWRALIIMAESSVALGQPEEAITSLDIYLEQRTTAADVLLRRGDLKAELGDIDGAEADFRAALVYLPGDEAVLERLDEIGVER